MNQLYQHIIIASPLLFLGYLFRFKIGGIPFTLLEAFTYILLAMYLAGIATKKIKWKMNTSLKRFYLPVFTLLIGATLAAIFAPTDLMGPDGNLVNTQRMTWGIWKGWIVAPMIYFFLLTQAIDSKEKVKKITTYLIYSGVITSTLAFLWIFIGDGITGDQRLRGLYESANYLALFIAPITSISLAKTHLEFKLKNIGISVFLIITLLMTKSYAGILAVSGSLFLYFVYLIIQKPAHRQKIIRGLVSFGILFLLIIISQINTPKFKQFLDLENRSSSTVRLELYEVAINLIQKSPFMGIGPGLFQPHYQKHAPIVLEKAPMEWNMPHSHNLFLEFWLNTGLIGLIAFIWMIIIAHKKFTIQLLGWWTIIFHGLFDMPFWKNDLSMIFWVIFATIAIQQNLKVKTNSKTT